MMARARRSMTRRFASEKIYDARARRLGFWGPLFLTLRVHFASDAESNRTVQAQPPSSDVSSTATQCLQYLLKGESKSLFRSPGGWIGKTWTWLSRLAGILAVYSSPLNN
jgi:hypothetical protein